MEIKLNCIYSKFKALNEALEKESQDSRDVDTSDICCLIDEDRYPHANEGTNDQASCRSAQVLSLFQQSCGDCVTFFHSCLNDYGLDESQSILMIANEAMRHENGTIDVTSMMKFSGIEYSDFEKIKEYFSHLNVARGNFSLVNFYENMAYAPIVVVLCLAAVQQRIPENKLKQELTDVVSSALKTCGIDEAYFYASIEKELAEAKERILARKRKKFEARWMSVEKECAAIDEVFRDIASSVSPETARGLFEGLLPFPSPTSSCSTEALAIEKALNKSAEDIIIEGTIQARRAENTSAYTQRVPFQMVKGSRCLAKYSKNEHWYRARVLAEPKESREGRYTVRFEVEKTFKTEECRKSEIAFLEAVSTDVVLEVGTRVVSWYVDNPGTSGNPNSPNKGEVLAEGFFAGTIAERPGLRNSYRYLVFFDDGYVQYCRKETVHVIYHQPGRRAAWQEISSNDTAEFVRGFMEKYPENAMLRLRESQTIRAEYRSKWYDATVLSVDASLVRLHFLRANNHKEVIYRGSTRLGEIFLKAAEVREQRTKGRKNVELRMRPGRSARMEYSLCEDMGSESPEQVKGTPTSLAENQSSPLFHNNESPVVSTDDPMVETQILSVDCGYARIRELPAQFSNRNPKFDLHDVCGPGCCKNVELCLNDVKGENPLFLPFLCGWQREECFSDRLKDITYRAPCGRRFRNLKEVNQFLAQSRSKLSVDNFSFDSDVKPLLEYTIEDTNILAKLDDISSGRENVPIPVVNCINAEVPQLQEYLPFRIAGEPSVNLNNTGSFIQGCDCTDGCMDRQECACLKLTIKARKILPHYRDSSKVGYDWRRLRGGETILSGIYECNDSCRCAHSDESKRRCANRVVQFPLNRRLQLFKSPELDKGWGVRTLDDIPKGAFVCIYSGEVFTGAGAETQGKVFGDEYLADLDFIEQILELKGTKDGYEESVVDPSSSSSEDVTTPESCPSSDNENGGQNSSNLSPPSSANNKSEDGQSPLGPSVQEPDAGEKFRERFYGESDNYAIDANKGNIGRYLNHSCSPNMVVQNVFVDTHDLRFPWIAFFAKERIPYGSELCWDYGYEAQAVPGKVVLCKCRAPDCKKRLL